MRQVRVALVGPGGPGALCVEVHLIVGGQAARHGGDELVAK